MTLPDINSRPHGPWRGGLRWRSLVVLALGLLAASVVFTAAGVAAADEETVFLEDISDLPLAPGLTEQPDAGLVFDKPDGRIIEATATGSAASSDVVRFYRDVLPALGWRGVRQEERNGDVVLVFDRDDERMTMTIAGDGGDGSKTIVRFELSPQ